MVDYISHIEYPLIVLTTFFGVMMLIYYIKNGPKY
jgi:hypothetical protein